MAERVEWSEDVATEVILGHTGRPGSLLPALHALVETFGYVDPRAVPLVARLLNLSRADVHGVVTFYRDFRTTPPAPVRVQVCRAEACQAVGGHALADHARQRLGTDFGGRSADGDVDLDQVFCLGNCGLGPSVTVDGRVYGRVTPERLDALLDGVRGTAAEVGA
jgi:formate dehydrogenase subunit gamma